MSEELPIAWMWYVFLLGMSFEDIAIRTPCTPLDAKRVIDGIMHGVFDAKFSASPVLDMQPYQKWTQRQVNMLHRLRMCGWGLQDSAKALYRKPENVKAKYLETKHLYE